MQAKYEQVKNYIIDYIRSAGLKYNDRIPTENELMEMFNVSRHTIRRALSDLINQGWLYSLRGSGTFVADPNADEKLNGKMIGVITTYFKDYIFPDILTGIDDVVSEKGYNILLGTTKNNIARERVVLENMLNSQLAGLIVEPTKSVYPNHNLDLYQKFRDRGIPIVFIHATYRNFPSAYVVEDDQYAGYIATKHLIDIGHKNIIGIFKQDDMQGHGRYEGYVKAHQENKLPVDMNRLIWFTTEEQKDFITEERLASWIKKSNNATAFVCYNDQIAIQLINALSGLGYRIPNDFSIVSFDNSNLADKTDVKLTTVAHPKSGLGEMAAKGLLSLIENPRQMIEHKIIPDLIIRESTQKLD